MNHVETPAIHQVWNMDFLAHTLFDGRRFRVLAVVDNCSKKCLGYRVGQSLKGVDVRDELTRIAQDQCVFPQRLQCDNGSEFISLDRVYALQPQISH